MTKKRFFYGWIIVFAATLLSGAGAGIISFMMSAFIKPVSEALGVDRATFSTALTSTALAAMLFLPLTSRVFKRFPLKKVVLNCLLGIGMSLFGFSFITEMWMFYPLYIICGICQNSISSIPLVILLSNWFSEKQGLATAITFSGGGLMSMLFMPVLNRVIENEGWRFGYVMLAITFAILTIPTILFLIKEKPQDMGLMPLGATSSESKNNQPDKKGYTSKQAIRTSAFWIFCITIFLFSLSSRGAEQHLMSFWSDLGSSPEHTAMLYSVMMGVGIAGKTLLGIIYDKFGLRKASVFICTVCISAYLMFVVSDSGSFLLAGAVVFGLSSAIQILPATYMVNKLFGDRDYSTLYAYTTMFFFFGSSVGVIFSALTYDNYGSYLRAWYIYALLTIVILILMLVSIKKAKEQRALILGETYLPELE